MTDPIEKTDEEWRSELTPEQYRVLRQKGTERAFTGALWDDHEPGRYLCAGCGTELFRSEEKFESGSGWPSFTKATNARAVASDRDTSHGMERVEVHCAKCGGHLGHVFQDGPPPTGERYCINSASLKKSRSALPESDAVRLAYQNSDCCPIGVGESSLLGTGSAIRGGADDLVCPRSRRTRP